MNRAAEHAGWVHGERQGLVLTPPPILAPTANPW